MDFLGLGLMEVLFILVIALILFSPAKLPEIGAALGKGLRQLQKASSELTRSLSQDLHEEKEGKPQEKSPEEDKKEA